MLPTILHCCGNVFTELLPSNNRGIHRLTDTCTTVLIFLRVFFAAGMCLLSRCLATIGVIHFIEPSMIYIPSFIMTYSGFQKLNYLYLIDFFNWYSGGVESSWVHSA
jgi:hypothetical protein